MSSSRPRAWAIVPPVAVKAGYSSMAQTTNTTTPLKRLKRPASGRRRRVEQDIIGDEGAEKDARKQSHPADHRRDHGDAGGQPDRRRKQAVLGEEPADRIAERAVEEGGDEVGADPAIYAAAEKAQRSGRRPARVLRAEERPRRQISTPAPGRLFGSHVGNGVRSLAWSNGTPVYTKSERLANGVVKGGLPLFVPGRVPLHYRRALSLEPNGIGCRAPAFLRCRAGIVPLPPIAATRRLL